MKLSVLVLVLLLCGCATKTYGRQGQLSDYEKANLTCHDIDLEIAKARGWLDTVNKESEFSGRDVLAILGDFGIGNAMERSAAVESANTRLDQLKTLRQDKNCSEAT
jgi:hypothetical protein